MLSRIPIRLRLTLAFAGVMAVVLLGAALLIRFSLARDLDESIRQSLETRAADVGALAADAGTTRAPRGQSLLTERGATLAQILDRNRAIVDATPLLRSTPLISGKELAAAERAPLLIDRRSVAGADGGARLLATRARDGDGRLRFVVVGAALGERDEALNNLSLLLAIGGPVALLLASAAGYGVAAAALRPVEAMRRRAAEITGGRHGERLPVPVPRDEIRRLGETLNDMLARIDAALAHERAFVADASHELRMPLAVIKTELKFARRDDQSLEGASRGHPLGGRGGRPSDPPHGGPPRNRPLGPGRTRDPPAAAARRRPAAGRRRPVRAAGGCRRSRHLRRGRRHGEHPRRPDPAGAGAGEPGGELAPVRSGGIRLWSRAGDGAAELHVGDQGPGLPPGFSATAFDRFTRGDAARGRGGAGLGLSIVRAAARAHGGEAHLHNLEPTGLDAWITLPRVEVVAPALTDPSSSPV